MRRQPWVILSVNYSECVAMEIVNYELCKYKGCNGSELLVASMRAYQAVEMWNNLCTSECLTIILWHTNQLLYRNLDWGHCFLFFWKWKTSEWSAGKRWCNSHKPSTLQLRCISRTQLRFGCHVDATYQWWKPFMNDQDWMILLWLSVEHQCHVQNENSNIAKNVTGLDCVLGVFRWNCEDPMNLRNGYVLKYYKFWLYHGSVPKLKRTYERQHVNLNFLKLENVKICS